MLSLNFTTGVLGWKAAGRLKRGGVTQTIRSASSSIVSAILQEELKNGDTVDITLDEEHLGYAKLVAMDNVAGADLTGEDAGLGGFDSRSALRTALKRAGYRFKSLDRYHFFRIRFEPHVVPGNIRYQEADEKK